MLRHVDADVGDDLGRDRRAVHRRGARAPCAHVLAFAGHHYALVIVEGLAAGSTTPVRGARSTASDAGRSPDESVPAERDPHPRRRASCACCSARAARPPRTSRRGRSSWQLDPTRPRRRRAARPRPAHDRPTRRRVAATSPCSSATRSTPTTRRPQTRERIADRRESERRRGPAAASCVDDFEEYCWLYHESWSPGRRALVLLGRADGDDLRRPRHDRRLEHLRHVGRRHPRAAAGGTTTSSAG